MERMKYKTYDDLPLTLGSRIIVPKEKLIAWIDEKSSGGAK